MPPSPPRPPPPPRSPPPPPPRSPPQRGYPHNFIWHDTPFLSWPTQISQLGTHRANESSTGASTTLHNEQRSGSRASASTEEQQPPSAPASSHNQRQNCRRYSWSAEEERLLLASVKQRGEWGQWPLVARDISGPGRPLRTSVATKQKYKRLKSDSRTYSLEGPRPTTSADSRYQATNPAPDPRPRRNTWHNAHDGLMLETLELHRTSSLSEANATSGASASSTASAVATASSTCAFARPSEPSTPRPATSPSKQALPIEALLASPAGPSTTQAAARDYLQAKQP